MAKNKENYLDYIPRPNVLYPWEKNPAGNVEIRIENRGVFCRLTQLALGKPKYTRVELDAFGTYIWESMDGKCCVADIGAGLRRQFGEQAEPLYPRLAEYLSMLHRRHLIVYGNKCKARKA